MRRFRVVFSKGEAVRCISHLDLMRTWERTFRRAGLRVSHTQGFNPRPRLIFAAPLAVGATSEAEILDVILEEGIMDTSDPTWPRTALEGALAPGISLLALSEVSLQEPAVMASVLAADYRVEVQASESRDEAEALVARFLESEELLYERTRKGTSREANMRPSVLALWLAAWPEQGESGETRAIDMRLRLDREGAAVRPEEVTRALAPGWRIQRVHRRALELRQSSLEEARVEPPMGESCSIS